MPACDIGLTPGLRVHVEGRFHGEDQFIADRVTFSTASLKTARAIEAGVMAADERSLANQERIAEQARALRQHGGMLETQKDQIAANAEKIIATTAIYLECDDLDERVEKLARSGIAFEHGPRNQPWMWREARLRDPDGNIIFLYKAGEARRFPPWRISDA